MFLIYLGAVGKSAQFPLHVWLPDAMEGPTPVSALIHAATMVTAGVFLVARSEPLFVLVPGVLTLIARVGAFTALLAATMACVENDIKRVLAYSTVSQLGYMMAAAGAGAPDAGFFHLLTHGVFKALLFLGAGAVIHAVGTNDIFRMGGLWRAMPQTGLVFVVGTLALSRRVAARRLLLEGGDPGGGLDGRAPGRVLAPRRHRVPDGVLHVPRRLHRVLRACPPARRGASARAAVAHARPAVDPRDPHGGDRAALHDRRGSSRIRPRG